MFSLQAPSIYQAAKCFATYGSMGHVEPNQLPSKGKPWSAVLGQDFVYKVDLIIPQDSYDGFREKVLDVKPPPQFQRIIMSLGDILSGDFFKEYIKIGAVMLLSEGRTTVENVFTIKDGILTMYMDKETYERCGLTGRPYGTKGKRGLKPRWIVEFDLKTETMWPGKKGFDRLIYACKNVLNNPITWLFCNVRGSAPDPDPLAAHFPAKFTSEPSITKGVSVRVPPMTVSADLIRSGNRESFEELATDLHEWLSLVRLGSPRIEARDEIDPFLSRYQVPVGEGLEQAHKTKLCKITWQGFLAPSWVRQTLVDVLLATPSRSWFALSSTTFSQSVTGDNKDYTMLRPPGSPGEFFLWDVHGHE